MLCCIGRHRVYRVLYTMLCFHNDSMAPLLGFDSSHKSQGSQFGN